MNQETRYLMGIYQVAVIIRDTLEYGIPKDNYDKNIYLQRKQSLLHGLEPNSPLSHFLDQQKDNEIGDKIRKNLNDFVELVYSDDARVCHIDGEKLIVDSAFANQVFDYVVGLRETLNDIIRGFMNFNKQQGTHEEQVEQLITKDEVFYRSITLLVLTDAVRRLFEEFNRTMNENQGKENPQSTFVVNELRKVLSFIQFVREHSKVEDEKFKKNVELSLEVIDLISGNKKPEEGRTIRSYIDNLHNKWTQYCQVAELDWKKDYVELWQELADFEQEMLNAQNQSKQETKVENQEEKVENQETTEEKKDNKDSQ